MSHMEQYFETATGSSTSESSRSTNTTSSSTTTNCVHGSGRVLSELDKLAILSAYKASIGPNLSAQLALLISNLYKMGMEADVIVHAIEVTGFARKPSPWYLKAVLTRYEVQRLFTMGDVLHDEDMFQEAKESEDLPW